MAPTVTLLSRYDSNSQPFAIIALLMFEENAFRVVARRSLSVSIYYSIAMYEITSDIFSTQKISFHRLFRAVEMSLARKLYK